MTNNSYLGLMTKEIIFERKDFDYQTLRIMHFKENDASFPKTDCSVSIKIIDEIGNVFMLIETIGLDMDETDSIRETHGCFIYKFEIDSRIIGTPIFDECLLKFENAVKYCFIPSSNGKYCTHYHYLWARRLSGEDCITAKYIKLNPVVDYMGLQIFKKLVVD